MANSVYPWPGLSHLNSYQQPKGCQHHLSLGSQELDPGARTVPSQYPRGVNPSRWGNVGRRWAHRGAEQHQCGWCTACAFCWHAVLHWRHCASPRYNPFQSSPQSCTNPHHPLINTVPRRHNWAFSIATGFTNTLTCKLQIKVLNLSINCLLFFKKDLNLHIEEKVITFNRCHSS